MDDRSARVFTVLFVCTGNICRSPMAERLLDRRTADFPDVFAVSSAGTNGLNGYPMDAPSAAVLRELGGDPERHVARLVDVGLLASSDLVLTATRDQRGSVLRRNPSGLRRTFTMREFGRLGGGFGPLEAVGATELRERVRAVAAQRGIAPVPDPESVDDIADPYGASLDVVRRTGHEVARAVEAVVTALGVPRDR